MLVANNSTEVSCQVFMPFYEMTGLTIGMSALHAVTLLALISYTWAMASQADLAHPVYAVVFQEMVMLSICALAESCLFMSAVVFRSEKFVVVYFNVAWISMLFHPVTWAVISLLRYYLKSRYRYTINFLVLPFWKSRKLLMYIY